MRRVLNLSDDLVVELDRRIGESGKSYDAFLRGVFGLPALTPGGGSPRRDKYGFRSMKPGDSLSFRIYDEGYNGPALYASAYRAARQHGWSMVIPRIVVGGVLTITRTA